MAAAAAAANPRPSDARRELLSEELSVPLVSNFFPIERYYDAADKVYESFQAAAAAAVTTSGSSSADRLDDAYVYGKRYCTFCLDAIPTHNYYGTPKYKSLQAKHQRQVNAVLQQLATVADQMDVQEVERQRIQAERQRLQEAERQRQEAKAFAALQQRASKLTTTAAKASVPPGAGETVQASAMSKLELLRLPTTAKQEQVGTGRVRRDGLEQQYPLKRDPSGEEPDIAAAPASSSRYRLMSDSEDDDEEEEKKSNHAGQHPLPPPIPPPAAGTGAAAPPSYDQATTQRNGRYHQRHFLGPGSSTSGSKPAAPSTVRFAEQQQKVTRKRNMAELQNDYHNAFVQAMGRQRIEVLPLSTYQGRLTASTNGCTVISALVAAEHLKRGGHRLDDHTVCQIIDAQCVKPLRDIRRKLGLGSGALIIPSDVHDHLVDEHLLQQELFEGAAGGNVMDPAHLGEFLKLLSVGDAGTNKPSQAAAATFFFREHVVSILKVAHGKNSCYYELVDSLPSLRNLGQPQCTRTVCHDVAALSVLLQWYTSKKFTAAHCSYIDKNPWDDAMADLDPRVFQGFVWSLKKPKQSKQ